MAGEGTQTFFRTLKQGVEACGNHGILLCGTKTNNQERQPTLGLREMFFFFVIFLCLFSPASIAHLLQQPNWER